MNGPSQRATSRSCPDKRAWSHQDHDLTRSLTSSACFIAFLSAPLSESLRHWASCLRDSGDGDHAMMGGLAGLVVSVAAVQGQRRRVPDGVDGRS